MNAFKRLLSAFTAVALLASANSIPAFADNSADTVYYGSTDFFFIDENGEILAEPNLIPETVYLDRGTDADLAYFNLVDEGRTTSVKNQNPLGSCWAHAGIAAAESSMISQGYANTDIDYSESHLIWFANCQGVTDENDVLYGDNGLNYGINGYDMGGNIYNVIGALTSWMGVQLEENATYADYAKSAVAVPEAQRYVSYGHAEDIEFYAGNDITSIKNALVNIGACHMSYYANDTYLNQTTAAYLSDKTGTNHAVTIVGWDDNYSVENFNANLRPKNNGAWIVKNSWDTWWGDDGYFYVSYEEPSMSRVSSIKMGNITNFADNYQYDGSVGMYPTTGGLGLKIGGWGQLVSGANVFTARNNNPITAVGFYTYVADTPYQITVYKNVVDEPTSGTKVLSQADIATYAGFHTIDLSKEINVTKGEKFAVIITFPDEDKAYTHRDYYSDTTGISYISWDDIDDDPSWFDMAEQYNSSMCIKAYSKYPEVKPVVTATPGECKVTLNWSAVTGATKYAVYTYIDGNYTCVGTTTATTHTINNLTAGKKCGFLVRALVNNIYTSYSANDIVYATPTAPTISKPEVTATPGVGNVTLNWNAISGATKYAVYTYVDGTYTGAGMTTSTSHTISNLTGGKQYGFLVRALVNNTWSPFTVNDVVYATPKAPVSTKPVITATPGVGSVTLNWNAISGATKYAVYTYVNGTYTGAGMTTSTSHTISNLTGGKEYGFLVRALVNNTWSPFTVNDVVYATPLSAASTKPSITVTAGIGNATVTWNAVNGATKYAVYTYVDGIYTGAGMTTSTSHTISNLTGGKEYGFLVRALVNNTWSPFTVNDVVYATPHTAASTKPSFTVAAGIGNATVTWNAVSGATKYAVFTYVDGAYKGIGNTTDTSYTISGLTGGKEYGFLVRALVNNTWSPFSVNDVVYATPLTAAAAKPSITVSAGVGNATVSWNAISGATNYAVYTYIDGAYKGVGTTTKTTHTVSNLTSGKEYGFLVRALVNNTWSPFTVNDVVYETIK